jgi:hypothetical protein
VIAGCEVRLSEVSLDEKHIAAVGAVDVTASINYIHE